MNFISRRTFAKVASGPIQTGSGQSTYRYLFMVIFTDLLLLLVIIVFLEFVCLSSFVKYSNPLSWLAVVFTE